MTTRFSALLLALLLLPAASHAQSLLLDNFNYVAGTALTANGWSQIGTSATTPVTISASNLTRPNYPGASGNAVTLATSGQDVGRGFVTSPSSGKVYAAFLVNVASAQTSGDYVAGLSTSAASTSFAGRVYVRSSAGGIQFGLSKTSTGGTTGRSPVYAAGEYAVNTTYLLVVTYTFVDGANNDMVVLNVLAAGDPIATEPATPTLSDPVTDVDLSSAGGFFLRQGSASAAPSMTIDGVRVGTSWNEAVLATQTVDDGAGYRLLGAPVRDVTVSTLADINLVQAVTGQYPTFPSPNLYLGYSGTGTTGYYPATNVATPVTPGYGFLWYLFDLNLTPSTTAAGGGTSRSYTLPERPLFASGPVNTTDVTVGFGFNTDGFYLLSNPFAQPLASTGITYTGSGTFATTLQAYDSATGFVPITVSPTTNLAMWQGFFAEVQQSPAAQAGLPTTFTYLAASRTDGPATLVSRSATTELSLTLAGTTDAGTTHDAAAIVRVDAAASAGWDAGDASKLTPPTPVHALVAPVGDLFGTARRQAVLSLPTLADVTLAFTTTHAGTFTLTADATGLPGDATVRDLVTGEQGSLAEGFTFTSDATDWTERFVVTFGRSTAAEQAPAGFSLGQVFPNPAAASARVALRVDAAQTVSVTVVDALGRTVSTVFEGALSAGQSQDLAVDTAQLAPGVYVVRIAGETFSATRRLVVAR